MASIRALVKKAKQERLKQTSHPIDLVATETQPLSLFCVDGFEIPHLPQTILDSYHEVTLASVADYIRTTTPGRFEQEHGPQLKQETDDYVYIANFISPLEEIAICSLVLANNDPWVLLPSRRLKVYGGEVTPAGLRSNPVPQWMTDIFCKLRDVGIVYPPQVNLAGASAHDVANHALLNYYDIGQGIFPHHDGPAYSPQAVILSFLSALVLSFWKSVADYRAPHSAVMSLYLEPRSLFIMKNQCYNTLLHGIEGLSEDILTENCLNRTTIQFTKQLQVNGEDLQGNQAQRHIPPIGAISRRHQRLSLTIRRVDPVLDDSQ